MDVLEDQFSLNAALPRTLRALFLKPGFLTTEYLSLKIARYIPPFRLYLFSSLIFFISLSFVSDPARLIVNDLDSISADTSAAPRSADPDTTDSAGARVEVNPGAINQNWAENIKIELGNDRLERATKARLNELGKQPPAVALREVVGELIQQAPKAAFLLLPVYALLLKLLYVRRKRYYVEHFIFALHTHAFAFLLAFIILILPDVPAVSILVLWVPIYFLLAMKRVYAQGWLRTTAKWLLLGWVYTILIGFAIAFTFVAAVFTV